MNVKTHSKVVRFPIAGRIIDRKTHARPIRSVEAFRKFLLNLTVCTWIVAVLSFILFYVAVRTDLAGTDWLAGLLLGMLILGWIMTAYYLHETMKPVHPPVQGDRHDKQN
jgi:hypothetical protein